jgi:allantoate deiminase
MQNAKTTGELAKDVLARCRALAAFSEDPPGLRRTFLSSPMRDVHREISGWLAALGVKTRVDAAGNLRGVYPGENQSAQRLLIGSHLDTVPNAGIYDGMLGVVLGVALLESLAGRRLPYAIEIVGFSEEEGVRFGVPFIGSRALVGRLDDELLGRCDSGGNSVRSVIKEFGLDPAEIPHALLHEDVCAYLEFHIEQGPMLERLNRPLGVVDAVVGQTRMDFVFRGRANHAGTTPMDLRFDAVTAAAEWIGGVERLAKGIPGVVATVGSVEVRPGATNVVAGEAYLSLDVRHADDKVRQRVVKGCSHEADEIAQRRGLTVCSTTHLNQAVVAMDSFLVSQIEEAIRRSGCEPHHMVSGAGHDAMILAEKVPSAMVFLRTPGGISHDPAESVTEDDVAKAIECGSHLLDQLAASPAFLSRTLRA